MKICIFGSSNDSIDKKYLDDAFHFGEMVGERNISLVFGGGCSGVMGAVARGVRKHGGEVIGITIPKFDVPGVRFEDCTDFIVCDDIRIRKEKLESLADASVVFPGGVGTWDELCESWDVSEKDGDKRPLILYNSCGFYDKFIDFVDFANEENFVYESYFNHIKFCSSAQEIFDFLTDKLKK